MFEHTVKSDRVEINAPQQLVWDILLDLKRYPEWNPFTHQVISTLRIDDPVDLYVAMPKRGERKQREFIKAVDKPGYLAWGMHMGSPWLLKALRTQNIEAIAVDRCQYFSDDHLQGLLTPVVKLIYSNSIHSGFNAVAYALKKRAESLWQQKNTSTEK